VMQGPKGIPAGENQFQLEFIGALQVIRDLHLVGLPGYGCQAMIF
jgi:hypothetical protein